MPFQLITIMTFMLTVVGALRFGGERGVRSLLTLKMGASSNFTKRTFARFRTKAAPKRPVNEETPATDSEEVDIKFFDSVEDSDTPLGEVMLIVFLV